MNARAIITVVLAGCVPILVYWDTVRSMVGHWAMDSYRHSWLIPPVALLLLWRDRARYSDAAFSGSVLGVVLVAALVVTWLIANATSVEGLEHLTVMSMVGGTVLALTGWRVFRSLWFPFAFLLLAVPMDSSILPALMDTTASVAVAGLQLFGIPALREGMQISLPGATFEVVEACSGFNYLNAGVALGVLIAHVMFRSSWRQLGYVAASVVMFIVVNGVRAFVIMFVGSTSQTSQMHSLIGHHHIFFGWILFLAAMLLMYWIAERFSDLKSVPRAST